MAPHLQQVPMDKSLLDPPQENADQAAPSPMPPPSTPDNTGNQQSNSSSERAPTPKSDQGKVYCRYLRNVVKLLLVVKNLFFIPLILLEIH